MAISSPRAHYDSAFQIGILIFFANNNRSVIPFEQGVISMQNHDLSYELLKYENQWVAISEPEQKVVGTGPDAFEAKQAAERNGYSDVLIMRVRATDARYAFKSGHAI